ncbi:hemolysin D [Psychromonas marina]|uniref:Hemolysin D n=1 Tax=Psychromonas marina TaxID=88364 RepID=A0ABQ6E033_9GAMM|nr:HlyD family secretion protein [Psychromonas marina]GLS90794.1 hemolysin D [Psychromonas marina]
MFKRYLITAILVIAAAGVGYSHYQTYTDNPWTRDGLVRAHIIQVTPRVTGQVLNVAVDDNVQVKKGDLLFEIDPSIYKANLNQATASQKQANALVNRAKNEERRSMELARLKPGSVPILTLNNLTNAVESAKANLAMSKALVEEAKLNLSFTQVYAPIDGYITNLNVRVGSQVTAYSPVVALIDEHSFWIEGFFKETDLAGVNPNDAAYVTLMTDTDVVLQGKITSIGYGIAKADGTTGNNLLPNVNPNFQWIRLAQRLPVKIKLDNVPDGMQLRVGLTASIKIIKNDQ